MHMPNKSKFPPEIALQICRRLSLSDPAAYLARSTHLPLCQHLFKRKNSSASS